MLTTSAINAVPAFASQTSMIVRYHDSIGFDDQHAYNFALVEKILEVTRPEYGDYKIEPYANAPNRKRQAQLLSEGELLNLHWATPGTVIAEADVIEIPVDILDGLQGYRVCMINRASKIDFRSIANVRDLKKIRLAQGGDWTEIGIYDYNGIIPLEAPSLNSLYIMLGFNRFDCLPLGVNEIQVVYRMAKPEYPFLAIEPNLLIYYNMPIHFYVSKKTPELAARLLLGLHKLKANGVFDALLKKYFYKDLSQLHLESRKIICLVSPYDSDPHQCTQPIKLPPLFSESPLTKSKQTP